MIQSPWNKLFKPGTQRVYLLSSAPVENRVAVALLQLAQKLGKKRELGLLIDAALSRNSLAEVTGSTPETTSRVMSQLQAEGIIHTGRQWVAAVDLGRLEVLGFIVLFPGGLFQAIGVL